MVGHVAEHGRRNTGNTECKPEKEPGNQSQLVRQQLLGIEQDRRESLREHEPDTEAQHDRPRQRDMRHQDTERRRPQNRHPDYIFAADTVADRPSHQSVSYTHLDVYKRQTCNGRRRATPR